MEKAEGWSEKMAALEIYNPHQSRLTKHQVKTKIAKFEEILGMFDSLFAQV
jgi:protein subunit release factor A